jgi:hypothetical protein
MSAVAAPPIWAIIINWQRPHETCACLNALLAGMAPEHVLVLDNGSRDDSVAQIQRQFPRVRLLPLAANFGFARAANIGIQVALQQGAAGVFLLNNDALVEPSTVAQLAAFLFAEPRRGIVSPKIYLTDQPGRFWAIGGLCRERRVISLGEHETDHGQYDTTTFDFLYGCAMLIRASVFAEIGLFDEQYFMYYEDIDFCLRARQAGYRAELAPHLALAHSGSRSTADIPARKIFYNTRSRMLFFRHHLAPINWLRFLAAESRYTLKLMLQRMYARDLPGALAHLTGRLAAFGIRSRRPPNTRREL